MYIVTPVRVIECYCLFWFSAVLKCAWSHGSKTHMHRTGTINHTFVPFHDKHNL